MAAASTLSSLVPRGLRRWLDSMPHPPLACEIAPRHVAVARGWQCAFEPLAEGAVVPSPVELNLADPSSVRTRMQAALHRIGARGPEMALLLPDQVIRVFLLHFETFPRRNSEVIPLLRWRLKKSVPFDMEETAVSYQMQPLAPAQARGVAVLAAVARQSVVRQYEELAEALNLKPGVVLSSSLASLPLLRGDRPTLLARCAGSTLTTVIIRGETLCVYRCTDLASAGEEVHAASVLEEIYPAVAFFQDTWRENISEMRLAGFGPRQDELCRAVEAELGTRTAALLPAAGLPAEGKSMIERQLEALAGWAMEGAS
jgi:type IV pilus assembly protein PilM